jgi:hypothetical protein
MPSSGMLRRVVFVITDVSVERIAHIIRVATIGELGRLAVISNRSTPRREKSCSQLADSCNPDDVGGTLLRNVGSYKTLTT